MSTGGKRESRRSRKSKNETHRDRYKINEYSAGRISDYPKGPQVQSPEYTNFVILSWNANGIRPRTNNGKIQALCRIVVGWKPDFITIQETHLDRESEYFLDLILPNYYWITNNHTPSSRGVAIGLKRSKQIPFPINEPFKDEGGRWLLQPIRFKGSQMVIASIYKPDKQGKEVWPIITKALKEKYKEYGTVLAGDFNSKPSSREMTKILSDLASCHLSPIKSDAATHGNGSQIDYICIHDKFTTDVNPFMTIIPYSTDHGIIVGGIRRQRERIHLPNPRISKEYCENPEFIKDVINKTGIFHPKGCPFEYMGKLKENIQITSKQWNGNGGNPYRNQGPQQKIVDAKGKMLWKLISFCHRIKQYGNFPKKWLEFETIQSVIKEGKKNFPKKPKSTATTLELLKRIRLISKELHTDVPQFKIFNTRRYTEKAKFNWKPYYKSIVVDKNKVPVKDKIQEKEILTGFWSKLLGNTREWNKEIILKLMEGINIMTGSISCHFSKDEIFKFIRKRRNSAPGPDGIPMEFYANTIAHSHIMKLWIKMLNSMAIGKTTPEWLVEGNLILLPKQEGNIGPDKFRPITVSNTDYRLIMGLWARRLTKTLDPWISKPQKALLSGRNIRQCVENIVDPWYQSKHEKKLIHLLQTDFAKAFDFVNREAITFILDKMNINNGLRNALKIALGPAPTYLCIPKTTPVKFIVCTGVKQGCPASPLMFIMIEDLLIRQLEKIKEIIAIEAYADDIGILIDKDLNGLNEIGGKIKEYCEATGAQLNMDKCSLLATQKQVEKPEIPTFWEKAQWPEITTYLGIVVGRKIIEKDKWEGPNRSAAIIASKMHEMKAPLHQKCKQINTYMVPLYNYIQRHYIMSKSAVNSLHKHIRHALGTHNFLPDRVLFANREPLKIKRPIIHPFYLGVTILALSPTVAEIQTEKAICSNTIMWHQQVAREIINKKIGRPTNHIMYNAPYNGKKMRGKIRKAIRATLTRTLVATGMWKLLDQIEGTDRLIFAANFFKIKKPREKMILITVLCKGWSLKHQYGIRNKEEDMTCSACEVSQETYKHILEECEGIKEVLKIWKNKWDRSPPINHGIIKWPTMGADIMCAKWILTENEIKIRCIILKLIHDVMVGCRKQEINMNMMEEEIRKLKWVVMKKKKVWKGKPRNNYEEQMNNGLGEEEQRNSEQQIAISQGVENQVNRGITQPRSETPPLKINLPSVEVDIMLIGNKEDEENRKDMKCSQQPTLKQWKDINQTKKSVFIGFFDGSGKQNPQIAGGGWVLYFNQEEIQAGAVNLPYKTSNDGESAACAALLEHINKLGLPSANIFGDSKMIIDHMTNRKLLSKYAWADILIPYQFEKWKESITFNHIPRIHNKRADAIANAAAISLKVGMKVAMNSDQIQREVDEKQKELPMKCKVMDEFIGNPKKMMIAFPIEDNFRIPLIGRGESEIGVVEDFREIKYTGFKSISIPKIDSFFKTINNYNNNQ
jgi:ribonuclease HI/exonuclease III